MTLDFYLLHNPSIPDKRSSEILELSDFLNRLQMKLGGEAGDKFRNPNGVYMKLMNFRRFDPSYEGKGLERGGKDDEVVWGFAGYTDVSGSRCLTVMVGSLQSQDAASREFQFSRSNDFATPGVYHKRRSRSHAAERLLVESNGCFKWRGSAKCC